jgi:hypothetical protein
MMEHPMNEWSLEELMGHFNDIYQTFYQENSIYRNHVTYDEVDDYLWFLNLIIDKKTPKDGICVVCNEPCEKRGQPDNRTYCFYC